MLEPVVLYQNEHKKVSNANHFKKLILDKTRLKMIQMCAMERRRKNRQERQSAHGLQVRSVNASAAAENQSADRPRGKDSWPNVHSRSSDWRRQ